MFVNDQGRKYVELTFVNVLGKQYVQFNFVNICECSQTTVDGFAILKLLWANFR